MSAVLGIDAATAYAAVALMDGERLIEELEIAPGGDGRPRHSAALLPAIEELVAAAGGWDRIELIGVGVGPGSFTGLRIGISTARALAQARELPIVGVSSLAALGAGIAARDDASGRPRLAALDARRDELFAALWDPSGAERWPPLVAAPELVAERIAELGEAPLACGDGALRYRAQIEAAGAQVPPDGDRSHRIAARYVCGLAKAGDAGPLESVEPAYLREPDAKRWLERG